MIQTESCQFIASLGNALIHSHNCSSELELMKISHLVEK